MPAAIWKARASTGQEAGWGGMVVPEGLRAMPLRMPRTEPSQNPNCTIPLCRLLQYHGPVLAAGIPRYVVKLPAPIQVMRKSRAPVSTPPRDSPKAMVLDVPSAISVILVLELAAKGP